MPRRVPLFALLAVGSFVAGCTPDATAGEPCNADADCVRGSVCVGGFCEEQVLVPADADAGARLRDAGGAGDDAGAADVDAGPDGGVADAGAAVDVDGGVDAGGAGVDAGPTTDAGGGVDAGVADAGVPAPDVDPPLWPLPGWTTRVAFDVSWDRAALADFPVLLSLPTDDTVALGAQAGGADVRVTDENGAALPFEIERWEGGALVWARVPVLDDGVRVYLYAGNAGVDPAEDPQDLWTGAGYASVWHFGAGDRLLDSARTFTGTPEGAPTFGGGPVGDGLVLDGASRIDMGDNVELVSGAGAAAACVWVAPAAGGGNNEMVSMSAGPPSEPTHSRLALGLSGGAPDIFGRDGDGTALGGYTADDAIVDGEWSWVCGLLDLAVARLALSVNGQPVTGSPNGAAFTTTSFPTTPSPFSSIGSDDDGSGYFLLGELDEVRVSRVSRGPAWFDAEHRSMTGQLLAPSVVETVN